MQDGEALPWIVTGQDTGQVWEVRESYSLTDRALHTANVCEIAAVSSGNLGEDVWPVVVWDFA